MARWNCMPEVPDDTAAMSGYGMTGTNGTVAAHVVVRMVVSAPGLSAVSRVGAFA